MPTCPRLDPEQTYIGSDITFLQLTNDQTLEALLVEIDGLFNAGITASLTTGQVTSDHILDGTIVAQDIADGVITLQKLAPGVITGGTTFADPCPIGTIVAWGGSVDTIPQGFLPCDGTTRDATNYPSLGAVLLTGASSIHGATTGTLFTLPDLTGRGIIGSGSGGGLTVRTPGQSGGAETHSLSGNEMAYHRHSMTNYLDGIGSFAGVDGPLYGSYTTAESGYSSTTTKYTSYQGNGTPFNIMHPYRVCPYMIRADVPVPGAPTLTTPASGATGQLAATVLAWTANADGLATAYEVDVATDAAFTLIEYSGQTSLTTLTIDPALTVAGGTYYWRVRAVNPGGNSAWVDDTYDIA
jgi:microcystin-dependent protein